MHFTICVGIATHEFVTKNRNTWGELSAPDHQWTYDRDGKLFSDRGMEKDLNSQDWNLCRGNQLRISPTSYRPGLLSKSKERNVHAFICWYLQKMCDFAVDA